MNKFKYYKLYNFSYYTYYALFFNHDIDWKLIFFVF